MPNTINFPDHLRGTTYQTFYNAFADAVQSFQHNPICASGYAGDINISSILTKLIHQAGRFAERWASDILFDIDNLRTICENHYHIEDDFDEILIFGIRRDGVDHGTYVMNRLLDTQSAPYNYVQPTKEYRRILAVHVQIDANDTINGAHKITATLRNITDNITRIDKNDIDDNGQLKILT